MSTRSTTKPLTPAEKRKITLAAKAEKERQKQAAVVAETSQLLLFGQRASLTSLVIPEGGRKAKADANKKAGTPLSLSVLLMMY